MKAIKLARPASLDTFEVAEIDNPGAPGPGEVRVRLHANSLNYHDYAVAVGAIPTAKGRIPMSDGAGVVEAVGDGVTEFAAGDHVVSVFFPYWQSGDPPHGNFSHVPGDGLDGFAREAIVAPVSWFTRAPKGWSHVEAATLPCAALTAWRALVVEGGLKAGDSVLILGTGGVAIFALQMAKAMGATAIVTSSSDDKLARAREMGADFTVNYKADPDWGSTVRDWTGKRGVDHVLEIGGPGTLAQSITAARIGGHISLIGILTGIKGEVPTLAMMAKQIKLKGIVVGSRAHQADMIRALEATGIRPVIDKTFPLANLADAFRYEETGQHFGKICIEM
ncbi:NAD(P)-dependent alcohol dehydrogenase [Hyphomicrobium sp.]|uniref:zinc-dependent alcohol dehydrogenase family protein n=1 Tax=Hyphomicrobium sp. TaxID=82 RepID=UPI002CD5E74B|nr:NAD(P)-dependent alcohol dehydrogenase [Hyphomicrobium sp.]HRN87521.1 NAD(P)-dependent alcohol dehydrogenase [Hyphomicrobium sp.]HRQ28246.1 NAD(P)-dependent alcohol dehydrogenase [Hyphomicrobium sp.]